VLLHVRSGLSFSSPEWPSGFCLNEWLLVEVRQWQLMSRKTLTGFLNLAAMLVIRHTDTSMVQRGVIVVWSDRGVE